MFSSLALSITIILFPVERVKSSTMAKECVEISFPSEILMKNVIGGGTSGLVALYPDTVRF
jgi:hypothetical protein